MLRRAVLFAAGCNLRVWWKRERGHAISLPATLSNTLPLSSSILTVKVHDLARRHPITNEMASQLLFGVTSKKGAFGKVKRQHLELTPGVLSIHNADGKGGKNASKTHDIASCSSDKRQVSEWEREESDRG